MEWNVCKYGSNSTGTDVYRFTDGFIMLYPMSMSICCNSVWSNCKCIDRGILTGFNLILSLILKPKENSRQFSMLSRESNSVCLTQLPLDKMAAILADDIFKCVFVNENVRMSIQIWLKFVPKSPIYNNSALVLVMIWRRTGDKPLPQAMMTHFTDAYIRHWGEIS